jgi:hypothetical protein
MAINRSGALLTQGPLLRATLAFGWPLVAGMAFHSLFNLVDLYIVGQLPDPGTAIAAASIPSLVNTIPMIFYNGIVTAAATTRRGRGSCSRSASASCSASPPTSSRARSARRSGPSPGPSSTRPRPTSR